MRTLTRGRHAPPQPVDTHAQDVKRLEELRQWARESKQHPLRCPERPATEEDGVQEPDPTPSVRDRPESLDAVVGQSTLLHQLKMVIAGAQMRGTRLGHILLCGPPGSGKTSISSLIAQETSSILVTTTGLMLKKPTDLMGLAVKSATVPTVLFIDELHSAPKKVLESLYTILEDGKVDLIAGSGMETATYSQALPLLIVVGATTRPGLLPEPLRQRFSFTGQLDAYSDEELSTIVAHSWDHVKIEYAEGEPLAVAQRSKGVPRVALKLGERVLDYAACIGEGAVTEGMAAQALSAFGIDAAGLTELDYLILDALVNRFAGRSVGIEALAAACNLECDTIVNDHEGYLVRAGFMSRSRSGRMALPAAHALLQEAS